MTVPILRSFCESCRWYGEKDLCDCRPRRVLNVWLAAEGGHLDAEDWLVLQGRLQDYHSQKHRQAICEVACQKTGDQ